MRRFTMASLLRKTDRPLTPEMRRRLLLAAVASAATGGIIYILVMHIALPGVRTRLTPARIEWLRESFTEHPLMVLGVIAVFAALLAAPVFGVFRWVYGPLIRRGDACSKERG
jgi:hypothetical protein